MLIKLYGWLLMTLGIIWCIKSLFCFVFKAWWDKEIRSGFVRLKFSDPLFTHLNYICAGVWSPSGFSDFCLPPSPFPCHEMSDCDNNGYSYSCKCKPGYTGDGFNCTGERSREQEKDTNSNWGAKSANLMHNSSVSGETLISAIVMTGWLSKQRNKLKIVFYNKILHSFKCHQRNIKHFFPLNVGRYLAGLGSREDIELQ